jgi:hypothetical protein
MKVVECPFCGVAGDAPHERQEACINALQSEIARTRAILERVSEPLPPASTAEANDTPLCLSDGSRAGVRAGKIG